MPPGGKAPLVDHQLPKLDEGKSLAEQRTYLLQETEALIEYVSGKPATGARRGRKARPIPSSQALDFLGVLKSYLHDQDTERDEYKTRDATDDREKLLDEFSRKFEDAMDNLKHLKHLLLQNRNESEWPPLPESYGVGITSPNSTGSASPRPETAATISTTTQVRNQDERGSKEVRIRDTDRGILERLKKTQPNPRKSLIKFLNDAISRSPSINIPISTGVRSAASCTTWINSAQILPGGDICAYTIDGPTADRLVHNRKEWISAFGESARVMVATYGVVVWSVPIDTVNMNDQEVLIRRIWYLNPELGEPHIERVRWLGKSSIDKPVRPMVIEFARPEDANEVIQQGDIAWEGGRWKKTQKYRKDCQTAQCYGCYSYDHVVAACTKQPVCGYCSAESHKTRDHRNKGDETKFKCPLCDGPHPAWSQSCDHMQKEIARILEAQREVMENPYFPVADVTPGVSERSSGR